MTQTQLPEDIRKQIEEEAAKSFPYDLKQTIGVNRDMAIKQQGYIAGATVHATLCQQKDEEIERLKNIIIWYDHPDADVEFAARQMATVKDKDEEIARLRKGLEEITQQTYLNEYSFSKIQAMAAMALAKQ